MANINYTPARNGKASAICCCCEKQSLPIEANKDGEPDLWEMARGWTQAPFPADFIHPDGSAGSMYTCPACNKLLRRGATLTMRNGFRQRRAAA